MVEAIRSYNARRGRLSARQRQVLAELSDTFDLGSMPDPLDLDAVFGRRAGRILEIGSGLGDAALVTAAEHPQIDYIAADVHSKGIARTLLEMQARGLTNLRVLHGDALDLIGRRLPAGCLAQILVFFPDPWPKARHNKRRLVRDEFVRAVARVLEPGGTLHLATDDRAYAQVMREVLARESAFVCVHDGGRVPARPRTKYEIAGEQQGRLAVDLVYRTRTSAGPRPAHQPGVRRA